MEAVLAEINGWKTSPNEREGSVVFGEDRSGQPHHGAQIDGFNALKADGSTACGCWIYSGCLPSDGVNKPKERNSHDYLGHGWGFAWPADRRIIYNRASAAPDGSPWSEDKKLVWWDTAEKQWTGGDVPDFQKGKDPAYKPDAHHKGLDAQPGDAPFILHEDGLGWLFVPKGLQDGPLPNHFEPLESPVSNALYPRDTNPPTNWFTRAGNKFAPPGDPRFPFVLTTYRLTEHHTAGGMSRFLSHLSELQPEMFVELSPELATDLGIKNTDHVAVVTMRGAIAARALVSRRMRPLQLNGKTVHQVALPFHWGASGPVRGDVVNDLMAISGEPNVTIMETKALTCNIVPGQLPTGPAYLDFMRKYAPQGDKPNLHPEQPPPGPRPGGKEEFGA